VKFRVLDIETIPDLSVWTSGNSKWLIKRGPKHSHELPQYGGVPAWFSGDETFLCDVVLVEEKPFPPPQAHRVVAIAWVDVVLDIEKSPRYYCNGGASLCNWAVGDASTNDVEKILLGAFSSAMSSEGGASLVTWNGRGFDLPVLSTRSLKLGVPFDWYYANRDIRYRFSEEGHLDLMDFLSDYGASPRMKLGDVARLIGLPGKVGMTGASVHDVYKESLACPETAPEKMAAVGRYCLQDAIQTALVFLRTRFHLGRASREEYNVCLDTFAQHEFIRSAIDVDWDKVRL
jgi:3'-5' exonuclease